MTEQAQVKNKLRECLKKKKKTVIFVTVHGKMYLNAYPLNGR